MFALDTAMDQRHVAERTAFKSHESPLAIIEPGDVIRWADVHIALAEIM